ncbi:hypothetical protein BY458DRAFT_553021 [Sporodiniella umbellata]|nr:hypothetical protein BY458DRAFT_553021 [Sporodiniella umbellata]
MWSQDSLQTTFSEKTPVPNAGDVAASLANETEEQTLRNQKLVEEFQYLLEKSQNLFSGLRDLSPTGSHRQWKPYFEKTFEVYTKLWKFQQTHRPILEDKANYGLKRWEVGEIASKIGQLYYHYYLRTSETNYLHEAYVFYEAIHDRQYFKDIVEVKNSALMIKKMRYYARFIIVCLLLNRSGNVHKLTGELEVLVEEYIKNFKPPDAKEWQMVLEEGITFTEAEKKLVPINLDKAPDKMEHRLNHTIEERPGEKMRLQEAILVGNYQKQIKFSELTLDMYRMIQSLEREPLLPERIKRPNPHKYLLYLPSLSQLLVYIAAAFKDMSDNAALLLYLSADGCRYTDSMPVGYGGGVLTNQRHKSGSSQNQASAGSTGNSNNSVGGGGGGGGASSGNTTHSTPANTTTGNTQSATASTMGVAGASVASPSTSLAPPAPSTTATSSSTLPTTHATAGATSSGASTMTLAKNNEVSIPSTHSLHPADLIPYTRKPLFLIVDSDHSTGFRTIPTIFDQPLMCLMSPEEYPSSVQDKSEIGSLFTLFLHTPLLGFCSVADIGNLEQHKWDECVQKIAEMERTIGQLLIADAGVDRSIKRFMTDDFLYCFIVRFVLCGMILRYHSSFKDEVSFPTSTPSIPDSIYMSPEIVTLLGDLTRIADVGTYFGLPAYATAVETTPSLSSNASTTMNNNNTVMEVS